MSAFRRPLLCTLASFVWALWTFAPAFTGSSLTASGRNLRVATNAKIKTGICEIFVTSPNTGMRTRMGVTPEVPIEQIKKDARVAFGFDQPFMDDKDFHMYLREDESTEIFGTIGEHNLKEWGPDGTEIHMIYQPLKK
mmetsp:Transcript_37130/g.81018  ORF Transcript_37130/g.81018 Transcript_37130/m.81018 type:complete len:138 (+) Transcript_37130:96-509(+)